MTQDSIQFACPACGETFSVSPQSVGHRLRCPSCNEVVQVKPAAAMTRMDLQVTREMSAQEKDEVDSAAVFESSFGGMEEPEAPPVMGAPLARPVEPPPLPPTDDKVPIEADKPPDGRLPKRAKLVPQESEMDMTPMVDCVFQLLIFFMLTASFAVQKSLLVPKPTTDDPGTTTVEPKENLESMTVRIDAQGHFFISGGELADEAEASARVELIMKLKQGRAVSSGPIPNKLMVLAHGDALHERVVEAIDAANDVGMEEVGLKTIEDGDE